MDRPTPAPRPRAAAAVIALAAGCTLAGYEFVRSVSSSLFLEAYGAVNLPFVMAAGPVGTLGMVWLYGLALTRFGARRVLAGCSLLAAVGLVLCWLGLAAGIPVFAALLYVLREGYIVLLIEQYWSFLDSTLDERQASRWNGPVCGVASVGAISGSLLVWRWAPQLGSESFVAIAAALLLPAAALSWAAYGLGGEPRGESGPRQNHGPIGLRLLRDDRRVLRIALLVICSQVVSTVLDLAFSAQAEIAFAARDERTAFFGSFNAALNAAAFLLQFGGTPLLLRWVPVGLVHMGIPALHAVAALVLWLHPSLTTAAAAFLLFKSVDYSVFRAAKEMLYLHTTFDARYRTKELIDAFGYRASKGGTAGLAAGLRLAGTPLAGAAFPAVVLVAAGAWLAAARRLPAARGAAPGGGD